MANTSGYVDLGDGRVYYEAAGEGAPLVFLHAGIVASGMWDDQWQEFSQRRTVIRYDMLGFGRSDRVEKPVSRRQELYSVLEAVGVQRAALVGCSAGGETALDAALERPELVSSLILVSAVPGGFEMQGEPPRYVMELQEALQRGDLAQASELLMRIYLDGPSRQPEEVDPLVRQRAAEMSWSALAKGGVALTFAPIPDPIKLPAVQRLSQIEAPVFVIAGGLDDREIIRAADVMAAGIPGARKTIMRDAAHLPNMERPAEFNQVVKDFLGA